MGPFRPGDNVHVEAFGKGVVLEARNGGRYRVDVKGRRMEVAASRLSPLPAGARRAARDDRPSAVPRGDAVGDAQGREVTLDLHGHTVDEALDALERAVNDAIVSGAPGLRVVHGRSGGRIRAAVHRRLGEWPSVRAFRLDPRNAGVTVVVL